MERIALSSTMAALPALLGGGGLVLLLGGAAAVRTDRYLDGLKGSPNWSRLLAVYFGDDARRILGR